MRVAVIVLAEFEKHLVIAVGHGEMIGGVAPSFGLVKGLLIKHRTTDGRRVGRGAALVRGVITPASGGELLIRGPDSRLGIGELGPTAVDPDSEGRIGGKGRRGGGGDVKVVIQEVV